MVPPHVSKEVPALRQRNLLSSQPSSDPTTDEEKREDYSQVRECESTSDPGEESSLVLSQDNTSYGSFDGQTIFRSDVDANANVCFKQRIRNSVLDLKMFFSPINSVLAQSNVIWLIYFLVLTTVFFMAVWVLQTSSATKLPEHPKSSIDSHVKSMLLVLMTFGFIGETYCILKRKDHSLVRFITSHSHYSNGYLLVGVYVFGAGTLFMIIQQLLAYPHGIVVYNCLSVNHTLPENFDCRDPENVFCLVDIIFDSMRMIFTATQILFLQSFAKATFGKSAFVKWILFHTMTANVCIWITYMVSETGIFKNSSYLISLICSQNVTAKLKFDEVIGEAEQLTEILIPFTLEYSLMVAGILYHISSNMKMFTLDNGITKENQKKGTSSSAGHEAISTGPDFVKISGHLGKFISHGSQPGLLLGLLFSILLLAAALTLKDTDSSHREYCTQFFFSFQFLLFASQIFALFRIIFALQRHTNHEHNFRPDDILLVIGFVGAFAFDFPLCYAAYVYKVQVPKSSATMSITLSTTVEIAITKSLQLAVILYSERFDCSHGAKAEKAAKTIRQCALFLLVTNLGIWCLDSFIEIKNSGHSSYPFASVVLGQTWQYIIAITYPLCIFFRFHSAAMLFELWAKFKFPSHYNSGAKNLIFVV